MAQTIFPLKSWSLLTSIILFTAACHSREKVVADDPLTVVDTNYGKISEDSMARIMARKAGKLDKLTPGLSVGDDERMKKATADFNDSVDQANQNTKPHIFTHHSQNDKMVDSLKARAEKQREMKGH